MWLFDNLFLDKNTPMQINIGEENTSSIPSLLPTVSTEESSQNQKMNTDTLVPSASWTKIQSVPESRKSADTSSTLSSLEGEVDSLADVGSIDIGGDMSFDATGIENLIVPSWERGASPSTGIDNQSGGSLVFLSDGNPLSSKNLDVSDVVISHLPPPADSIQKSNMSEEWVLSDEEKDMPSSDMPASQVDNTLFTLLNHSQNIETQKDDVDIPEGSAIVTENTIDSDSPDVQKDISSHLTDGVSPIMKRISWESWGDMTFFKHSENMLTEAGAILSEISQTKSATKIREILKQSINELHKIEVEDAFKKAKLMEKILEYDTNIAQIERETQERISALKYEREHLMTEIKKIGHESRWIKNLVQSFQKELDISA